SAYIGISLYKELRIRWINLLYNLLQIERPPILHKYRNLLMIYRIKGMKILQKPTILILVTLILVALTNGSANAQNAPEFSNDTMMDNQIQYFLMVDRLEYYNIGGGPFLLDTEGYIGKDLNRFWFGAE